MNATPVNVRIEPDLLALLDAYAQQHDISGRPEAVRVILRDKLEGQAEVRQSQAAADA